MEGGKSLSAELFSRRGDLSSGQVVSNRNWIESILLDRVSTRNRQLSFGVNANRAERSPFEYFASRLCSLSTRSLTSVLVERIVNSSSAGKKVVATRFDIISEILISREGGKGASDIRVSCHLCLILRPIISVHCLLNTHCGFHLGLSRRKCFYANRGRHGAHSSYLTLSDAGRRARQIFRKL